VLFGNIAQPAIMKRVTSLHMFESSPQSKCAVAYLLQKPISGEEVAIIVLYSVSTNMIMRLFRCDSEVTQMCTPGDDSILIAGTILGTLCLYDTNEFESASQRIEELDYDSLLTTLYPDVVQRGGPDTEEYSEKLISLKSLYAVQWPTFSTDGLPNYSHYSPIRKLVFITKLGGSAA